MSVQQLDKIDLIGINKETGNVELAIIDDLDWSDIELHLSTLQDKVNAYFNFIEDGGINEAYPGLENYRSIIKVMAQHKLPKEGSRFINQLRILLLDAGYGFEFELIELTDNGLG